MWLHGLWRRALHGRWAVSPNTMLSTLADAALLLVAEYEGLQSGFCAVDTNMGASAGLTLILVEPTRQLHGVGTGLLNQAERTLRELKVQRLLLGAGNNNYFWPGLPEEQGKVWSFFREHGFKEEGTSEDLIQDLRGFTTPEWVKARLASSCSVLRVAQPPDQRRIEAFERLHFPSWASYFDSEMRRGDYNNILLAEDATGNVVGTLLLRHNPQHPWTALEGKQIGTLNTLGVTPERQGQGIGLALTAAAMEELRKRGNSHCFVQWTGLTEWYGKLGAKTWAKYQMASKPL